MNQKLVYLFLQGVASPLFARLADELESRGHRCLRINFCPGDRLFWPQPGSINYHGRYDEWPVFIRECYQVHGVTDVILFSETRPLHRLAVTEAKHAGCRLHVFEEGYLRPYWLTIDSEGTNGNSQLPLSAEFYLSKEPLGN
jgi:capsular polysaccharide export protein